jgi:hypothetical protein
MVVGCDSGYETPPTLLQERDAAADRAAVTPRFAWGPLSLNGWLQLPNGRRQSSADPASLCVLRFHDFNPRPRDIPR